MNPMIDIDPHDGAGGGPLAEHHRELDEHLARLCSRVRVAEERELRAEWTAFERALLRHLEQEEAEILPGFAREDAAGAREILAEHGRIRDALLEIGLTIDLHLLRAEAVDELAAQLRAHARREAAAFYPWAKRHVTPRGWRSITRSLRHVGRSTRGPAWLGTPIM